MHHFKYLKGELYAEDVPLSKIAKKVGSPTYVYSYATLKRHFKAFQDAFDKTEHIICYSMKCNSNLAILKAFSNLGSGVDIVSGGELYRALKAGVDPQKIVFSGVGKTEKEINDALDANILMFNVESEHELDTLNQVAISKNKKAPIALRINPDVDPKTHAYITTGLKKSKFGIQFDHAFPLYERCKQLEGIEVIGVDCHIGSQLTETGPFVDALKRVLTLVHQLRDQGFNLKYLDLGGGLGIRYGQEEPPHPQEYATALLATLKDIPITLIFEPGRVLMGNAGILLTKTLFHKSRDNKEFFVVDAAMNDLIRPAFYQSFHEILPVIKQKRPQVTADIVGPICETGDFLATDRLTPVYKRGEYMAVMSAGAYGFVMSSNYNSRPRATEVLVNGDQFFIIRPRETLKEMLQNECIPPFLRTH